MCYSEGWQTYHRRIRQRLKNEIKRVKNCIKKFEFQEIFVVKPVKPKGCNLCAYTKKRYASPGTDNHPKKNKNHNSTFMRLAYRRMGKMKNYGKKN